MKRAGVILAALATVIYLAATPAFAQRGRGGMPGIGGPMGGGNIGMGRGGPMGMPGSGRGGNSNGRQHQQGAQTDKVSAKKSADQMLQQNPQLESKLSSLLPAGTDMQQAASGFKNLGQFVAAVHVSHNLGIPFDQLKGKMVGPPSEGLGKAIHDLKPDANSKSEVKKADEQAKQDIQDANEPQTGKS